VRTWVVPAAPRPWRIDRIDALLLGLLGCSLVPVWAVRYFPTQDGPSHIENAWIIVQLVAGGAAYADVYTLNTWLVPNWTSHLVLAALLTVLPPLVAHKAFVTLHVIFFVGAFRFLTASVDRSSRLLTLLAIPFAHNLLLYAGFYNFCVGVSLLFVTLAVAWNALPRWRPWQHGLLLNLLLVALYYCHVVSHALALVSLAFLALVRTRADLRRTGPVVVALVPTALLTAWFLLGFGGGEGAVVRKEPGDLLAWFVQLSSLTPYTLRDDFHVGKLVALLFVALSAGTAIERSRAAAAEGRRWLWRPRDAFLGLSTGLGVAYLVAPDSVGSGSAISFRLALLPPLALIPWLQLPSSAMFRRVCVLTATALALIHLGLVLQHNRRASAGLCEYTAGLESVERGETLLPITANVKGGDSDAIAIYLHAASYYALQAGAINLANYEASTDYFPVRFRPGRDPYQVLGHGWERARAGFDLSQYPVPIDVLLVWGATRPFPGAETVLVDYSPVRVDERLVLFRRNVD